MLRNSVVYFVADGKKGYDPIGSGVLVYFDGKFFVLSAAHVFESIKNGETVYLGIGPARRLFRLTRTEIYLSNKDLVNGNRRKDPLDLGVMAVPDWILNECVGKVIAVDESLVEDCSNNQFVQFYQAIGCPTSRNRKHAKKSRILRKEFTPEILVYSGRKKTADQLADNRFNDEVHVVMDFDSKASMNANGEYIGVPELHGISGGLMQGVYGLDTENEGGFVASASGIIIEKGVYGNSIVGVRFSIIFEWMRLHFNRITGRA